MSIGEAETLKKNERADAAANCSRKAATIAASGKLELNPNESVAPKWFHMNRLATTVRPN